MPKLLIVDDEPDVTEFAKNFFKKRKFDVTTASNGPEALEIIQRNKPDIMLLDIKMEGMDGLEVLEKIGEITKDVRIIMVSGIEEKESVEKAKKLGAIGFVHKPLVLEELERVVLKEAEKIK
ncbi:MAG: response regulator [Candidatus Omnitrophota bacterium]